MDPYSFFTDMGLQILDPIDPGRIRVLLKKTDLGPGLTPGHRPGSVYPFYNFPIKKQVFVMFYFSKTVYKLVPLYFWISCITLIYVLNLVILDRRLKYIFITF